MSRVSTQTQAGAVDQSRELEDLKKRSQFWDIWRRLRRNKLAMLGLIIVLVLVLSAIFANFIAPYDYAQQDLTNMKAWPSREHLLGTDDYGRDILSRIIYGGRVSLLVAILSIVFGLIVGGILGISAGYFGGIYDGTVMRIMDIVSPVIVESTLRIGGCILMISSLSFIGLGVQPPTPEWGSMLSAGRALIRSFWPIVTFPGLAIMLTLFGFNLFGDGLRDALDPKLKN